MEGITGRRWQNGVDMNMNTSEINAAYTSVDTSYSAYRNTSTTKTATNKSEATSNTKATSEAESKVSGSESSGVVYESSNIKNMSASDRSALVAKLKADSEARVSQLKSLVEQMFLKQGQKVSDCDSMWKMLASGNFTVDKATAEEAKEAISEDGYWGVEQTSQRIFDMAVALSGGDSDKMEDMLAAFKKGFKQATSTWGRDLPDISQRTYGAVLEKFEAYKNENSASQTGAVEA